MNASSLSELITQSFYAWEVRGRGWLWAQYPVQLEPPFRPFFLIGTPGLAPRPIDDGKRPTLLSSLVDSAKHVFSGRSAAQTNAAPFEEQEPFPAETDVPRVTLTLRVPQAFSASVELGKQLLLAFSTACYPVSYELVGTGGTVTVQLSCAEVDEAHIVSALRGYVSEVAVIVCADVLGPAWNPSHPALIVDFGLAEEFFLPLATSRSLAVDPYIALVAALGRTRHDECLCIQVVLERLRNPWVAATLDALTDAQGDCIIADQPAFLTLAKEKTRSPLYCVVLRVAAQAANEERLCELISSTHAFLLQFERSGGNALVALANSGYPEGVAQEALLLRESYRTGMLLSADELVGLVHLPCASITDHALVRASGASKALPLEAEGHDCIIGENLHQGVRTPASLSIEQRLKHLHIIGATGSGKSTLLLSMLLQDIQAGRGVALIDPHGDLVDDLLCRIPRERRDDVILIDPSDAAWSFGFNILQADSDHAREMVASDVVGIFRRLSSSWGDVMNTVLANALLAVLESPAATLLTLRRFLVEEGYRKQTLVEIHDPAVRYFWQREFPSIGMRSIGPILTRLDGVMRSKLMRRMVGQADARFRASEAMAGKGIVLAKLSHGLIGEENAALLGSLLVSQFHLAALSRQRDVRSARSPFFLYIDEVQHFVTPSMGTLLTGARKYGLGLTVAHHSLSQIERIPEAASALLDNAYTRIVFRVGESDAKRLASSFASFSAEDLQGLATGDAIIRVGIPAHDCNIHTQLLPEPDTGAAAAVEGIVEHSRQCYGKAASMVDQLLAEHFALPEQKASSPRAETTTAPPAAPTEETKKPPLPKPALADIKPPLAAPTPGRGGQEHKYLQHLIKRLAEERGFRATIEDVAGDGRADVVLRKAGCSVACEISITTTAEHEAANLAKCLAAGFDNLIFICQDKRRREKVRELLSAGQHECGNVSYISPDDLVAALERVDPAPKMAEGVVRGYKVKVSRQSLSASDVTARRGAIAEVIAKSLGKGKFRE